jgi:hypothetical protein
MSNEIDIIPEETRQDATIYRWSWRGARDRKLRSLAMRSKRKYARAGAIVGVALGAALGAGLWWLLWGW